MNEAKLIANKLRSHANRITIPTIPTVFFPSLHEFVAFLLSSSALQKPLKMIMAKGEEAEKHLKNFEKEGLDELKSKHEKMRKYVTNNNVPNQIVMRVLDAFESRLEKSDALNRMLFVPLEQALDALLSDGHADHSDFVQTFGKINRINDYKFINTKDAFPKFYAWEEASAYFAQLKQKADWFSLNQLMVFAERYDLHHYDTLISELVKRGTDPSKLRDEHHALMMYAYFDAQPSNLFPTIEEYKCHAMRLVESIIEIMTSLAPKYEVFFDPSNGLLQINGKKTYFDQLNCPSNIILAMLVPKMGPIKKKAMGYLAAQTKIMNRKTYDRTKPEPNIYEICRSINKHIAKDLGYPNFLIMPNETVQINPIYLE